MMAQPGVLPAGPTPEMLRLDLGGRASVPVARGRLLGARFLVREFGAAFPPDGGMPEPAHAFLFRYGVMVTIGMPADAEQALIEQVRPFVVDPSPVEEIETARIRIDLAGEERVDADGAIILHDHDPDRLQLVAVALARSLARSLALGRDEARIAAVFDRIDPLIAELQRRGRVRMGMRSIMRQIGDVMAAFHNLLGRAQIADKPDLLWDRPELERLHARLDTEYEISERGRLIEQKLRMVGDTADRLLDIAQDKRSVRLELAIIALIAIELVLSLARGFG